MAKRLFVAAAIATLIVWSGVGGAAYGETGTTRAQGVLSPDGSTIVFISKSAAHANSEIYVMDADGTNVARLTRSTENAWQPTWSPDGKRIAFVAKWSGNLDIYIMDKDGSNVEQLTDDPSEDTNPAFAPDGSVVAFVSARDGNMEIYTLDLESGVLTRRTDEPGQDVSPTWSPDGERIAYLSRREAGKQLRVMNRDGSEDRSIEGADVLRVVKLTWSPKGSRFACMEFVKRGVAVVCTMGTDGGELRRLYENAASSGGVSWSPDGERILFSVAAPPGEGQARGRGGAHLYAIDADGANLTQLSRP